MPSLAAGQIVEYIDAAGLIYPASVTTISGNAAWTQQALPNIDLKYQTTPLAPPSLPPLDGTTNPLTTVTNIAHKSTVSATTAVAIPGRFATGPDVPGCPRVSGVCGGSVALSVGDPEQRGLHLLDLLAGWFGPAGCPRMGSWD